MPRILKTVVPRIRKSIEERGLLVSAFRSVLLPIHLLQEYRDALRPRVNVDRSEFDREYGVETDGDCADLTHLSDLEIPSKNWIRGGPYVPISPEQLRRALALVPIQFEQFAFLDFGSGKGRALLVASEFPFKRVVGIEFSPQLHAFALQNIAKYHPPHRQCAAVESVCRDFLEFPLPPEPSVLFFFNPADKAVLTQMMGRISDSLRAHPRDLYLIYIAPDQWKQQILGSAAFLTKLAQTSDDYIFVYRARSLEGMA